jgi:hypothetical protein
MFDIQRLDYLLGTQSRIVLYLTISNQDESYLTQNQYLIIVEELVRCRLN